MIRVVIERHVAETLESAYEDLSRHGLRIAVSAPGFISGETLTDLEDPNRRVTLCKWRSEADWKRWQASEERRSFMNDLMPLMDREERITVLKHSE